MRLFILNLILLKPITIEGVANSDLGQHNAAIADYGTTIRLKPDYVEAYYNRGGLRSELNQNDSAIADYDEVIRLKPDYAEGYLLRGLAKTALGSYNSGGYRS